MTELSSKILWFPCEVVAAYYGLVGLRGFAYGDWGYKVLLFSLALLALALRSHVRVLWKTVAPTSKPKVETTPVTDNDQRPPPTWDAYMAACRALHWAQAQLRANGVQPDPIAPDAPHYPPEDHVFTSAAPRRKFSVLGSGGAKVDWQLVADHGKQAQANHYQSVEYLNERGGLSWCELYAVLHNRPWQKMDTNEAMLACRALEARYLAAVEQRP